jgi:hypothetical protein
MKDTPFTFGNPTRVISNVHKGIIDRYAQHKLHPGDGFISILSNDPDWVRLDTETVSNLSNIQAYLREFVPAEAYGSAELVQSWLRSK